MASYNHVTILGNLTRDAELKYLPSGTPCLELTVAVNEKWKDKTSGELKEEVSFIDCVQFGQGGEKVADYLKKGKPILVDGRLKQDRWEDKDGGKRSKIRVTINRITLVGGNGNGKKDDGAPSTDDVEV